MPEVIEQFSLSTNHIPLRLQKDGNWHAGWIGYVSGQLEFAINPTAGESIPAGKVLNPNRPIQITVEAVEGHVLIHWDSYLTAPVLERRGVRESNWVKVSSYSYDEWSLGVRLPLAKAGDGEFFRLIY